MTCELCSRNKDSVSQGVQTHFNLIALRVFRYDHPEWNPAELLDAEQNRLCQLDDHLGWQVTKATWNGKDNGYKFDELMRCDARLWYRTMFPQRELPCPKAPFFAKGKPFDLRRKMLMRTFITLAEGLLSVNGKGERERWYRMPIVAALSHGGRIHYKNPRQLGQRVVFQFLTGRYTTGCQLGSEPVHRCYMFNRWFSTHKVKWPGFFKKKRGVPVEAKAWVNTRHQFGVNLPVGGIGSPTANNGEIVGPAGIPFLQTNEDKYVTKISVWKDRHPPSIHDPKSVPLPYEKSFQHGHMLLRPMDGKDWGSLLQGVEESQPTATNMFGGEHGAGAGAKNTDDDHSVTGGPKMPVIWGKMDPAWSGAVLDGCRMFSKSKRKDIFKKMSKDRHPAKKEGKIVIVDGTRLARLVRLTKVVEDLCDRHQRMLFRQLLPCTQPQAQETLAQLFFEKYWGVEWSGKKDIRPGEKQLEEFANANPEFDPINECIAERMRTRKKPRDRPLVGLDRDDARRK